MLDLTNLLRMTRAGVDLPPVSSLATIHKDTSVLHVSGQTASLDALRSVVGLRSLAAHAMTDKAFEDVCEARQIEFLSANIFRVTQIGSLAKLSSLQGLELTDNTGLTSLDALANLRSLRALILENCPISVALDPLSSCVDLQYLWLSSRYSKPMRVKSLAPLHALSSLRFLKLVNVRVSDRTLRPLYGLTQLEVVELPNYFPHKEFVELAKALPKAHGHWLQRHAEQRTIASAKR